MKIIGWILAIIGGILVFSNFIMLSPTWAPPLTGLHNLGSRWIFNFTWGLVPLGFGIYFIRKVRRSWED